VENKRKIRPLFDRFEQAQSFDFGVRDSRAWPRPQAEADSSAGCACGRGRWPRSRARAERGYDWRRPAPEAFFRRQRARRQWARRPNANQREGMAPSLNAGFGYSCFGARFS